MEARAFRWLSDEPSGDNNSNRNNNDNNNKDNDNALAGSGRPVGRGVIVAPLQSNDRADPISPIKESLALPLRALASGLVLLGLATEWLAGRASA